MARASIKKSDVPESASTVEAKALNQGRIQGEAIKSSLSDLFFGDLSVEQKDELLKAIAVTLGFIQPDP